MKPRPQELETWIKTVLDHKPRYEQEDAKANLTAWVHENVRKKDRKAYLDFCVAELVTALEEREANG